MTNQLSFSRLLVEAQDLRAKISGCLLMFVVFIEATRDLNGNTEFKKKQFSYVPFKAHLNQKHLSGPK